MMNRVARKLTLGFLANRTKSKHYQLSGLIGFGETDQFLRRYKDFPSN